MELSLEELKSVCPCGKEHPIYVDTILIEEHALDRLPDLLARYGSGRPAMFCDDHTYEAAGKYVEKLLPSIITHKLPSLHLHANDIAVDAAARMLCGTEDMLIAVGSGTIHDITRFVAHEKKIPFISVPTAASVDGFVSTVAAMTWHGLKKSMIACAPIAVVADSLIFSRAPYRLTASGISDLYGKYTALTDWKISHLLTGEHFCSRIYDLEIAAIDTVTANLDGLRNEEPQAYEQLMYALLLSGLAMQMMGNSRPASGAEHHMSHLWEMALVNEPTGAYHGEKVSVGLSICTNLYHGWVKAIRKEEVAASGYSGPEQDKLRFYMPEPFVEDMMNENNPDVLTEIQNTDYLSRLPEVADIIDETLPSSEYVDGLLDKAGCCRRMQDIGLTEEIIPVTIELAPYIRGRLTFLKLSKLLKTKVSLP